MNNSLELNVIVALYGKSLDSLDLEIEKTRVLKNKVYEQQVEINHYERTKKQYHQIIIGNDKKIELLEAELLSEKNDHQSTQSELKITSIELQYALNAYTCNMLS